MIGSGTFREISEKISEGYSLGIESLQFLTNSKDILSNSNINEQDYQKKSVISIINATYSNIVIRHINPNRKLINAVKSLNKHVLEKYVCDNLDQFLESQYIEVPEYYAYLSGIAGYDVSRIGSASARFSDIDDTFNNVTLPFYKIGWYNV